VAPISTPEIQLLDSVPPVQVSRLVAAADGRLPQLLARAAIPLDPTSTARGLYPGLDRGHLCHLEAAVADITVARLRTDPDLVRGRHPVEGVGAVEGVDDRATAMVDGGARVVEVTIATIVAVEVEAVSGAGDDGRIRTAM
jgi:hypothetical protein